MYKSKGNMKYVFKLLVILNILIYPTLCFTQTNSLSISTTNGSPGDTVSVNVSLDNSVNIAGILLNITYDPAKLNAVDVDSTIRTAFFTNHPNVWAILFDTSYQNVNPGQVRIFAYRGFGSTDYMMPGTGPIAVIKFAILNGAQNGLTPVEFNPAISGDNTLSDDSGNSVSPDLINGGINIGGTANSPPVFDANYPASLYIVSSGQNLQFTVIATDADNDNITLSASNLPSGASFTGAQGSGIVSAQFLWIVFPAWPDSGP